LCCVYFFLLLSLHPLQLKMVRLLSFFSQLCSFLSFRATVDMAAMAAEEAEVAEEAGGAEEATRTACPT
jgi:hypothetical protein